MSTDFSTNPSGVPRDAVGGGHSGERDKTAGHRAGGHGPHSGGGHPHPEASAGAKASGGKKRRNRRGRRRRRPAPDTPQQPIADGAAKRTAADQQRTGLRTPSPADLAGRRTAAADVDAPAHPVGEEHAHHARARVSKPKPSDLAVTTTHVPTDPSTNRHPARPKPGPPPGATNGAKSSGSGSGEKANRGTREQSNPKPTPGPPGPKPKPGGGRNRRRRDGTPADNLRTVRETSAGGLVIADLDLPIDELSAALIGRVDRRGRMMWSLPKGHIETGETAEATAIREVAEETGIEGTVVAPLGKIDYWFVSEGKRIHKTVHHYLLRSTGGELSDEDYEVSEVAWVLLRDLPRTLTYPDERRLARMARGVISDLVADPDRMAKSEAERSRTEPNAYERAAAARNERRNETPPPPRPRRRRRRPRRKPHGDD